MGRLLDEDDVVDWLLKRTEMYDGTGHFVDENVVKKNIESQIAKIPSAQPEQQIRCNECIYFDKYTDGIEKYQWDGFCSDWARNTYEDWYCSRAERREDE